MFLSLYNILIFNNIRNFDTIILNSILISLLKLLYILKRLCLVPACLEELLISISDSYLCDYSNCSCKYILMLSDIMSEPLVQTRTLFKSGIDCFMPATDLLLDSLLGVYPIKAGFLWEVNAERLSSIAIICFCSFASIQQQLL